MVAGNRRGKSAPEHLVIFADGTIGPRRSGAGILVTGEKRQVLFVATRTLPVMTNNEAEYAALVLALETATKQRARSVEVRLDSEVVVSQMAGRFAVNSPKLKAWHRQACALATMLPRVSYRHIPRDQNRIADALAAEAAAGRAWEMTGEPCSG